MNLEREGRVCLKMRLTQKKQSLEIERNRSLTMLLNHLALSLSYIILDSFRHMNQKLCISQFEMSIC